MSSIHRLPEPHEPGLVHCEVGEWTRADLQVQIVKSAGKIRARLRRGIHGRGACGPGDSQDELKNAVVPKNVDLPQPGRRGIEPIPSCDMGWPPAGRIGPPCSPRSWLSGPIAEECGSHGKGPELGEWRTKPIHSVEAARVFYLGDPRNPGIGSAGSPDRDADQKRPIGESPFDNRVLFAVERIAVVSFQALTKFRIVAELSPRNRVEEREARRESSRTIS
jgi:hypothetical protein